MHTTLKLPCSAFQIPAPYKNSPVLDGHSMYSITTFSKWDQWTIRSKKAML